MKYFVLFIFFIPTFACLSKKHEPAGTDEPRQPQQLVSNKNQTATDSLFGRYLNHFKNIKPRFVLDSSYTSSEQIKLLEFEKFLNYPPVITPCLDSVCAYEYGVKFLIDTSTIAVFIMLVNWDEGEEWEMGYAQNYVLTYNMDGKILQAIKLSRDSDKYQSRIEVLDNNTLMVYQGQYKLSDIQSGNFDSIMVVKKQYNLDRNGINFIEENSLGERHTYWNKTQGRRIVEW